MKKMLGLFLCLTLVMACAVPGSQSPVDVMVAVGGGGMIARSIDHGATWERVMSFKTTEFKGNVQVDADLLVKGELNRGRFAQIDAIASAVGQINSQGFMGNLNVRGTLYQQLGQQWVGPIANPFGVSNITAASYMSGVFVAGGQLKKLSRSLDYGATWAALIANPFAAGSRISGMASGGGVFVSVTDAGEIAWSTDGNAPWTAAATNPFGGLFLGTVVYAGNNVFVAAGGSKQIGYSLDSGKNWTLAVNNPFTAGTIIQALSFGSGVIVAANNAGQIALSNDLGKTWGSAVVANPFAGQIINAGCFGNGVFVFTANNGEIARSIDLGKTWGSLITNPFGASTIWCVSYNFGVLQAGAQGGLTARSYDTGVTWGSLVINPFGANAIDAMASTQGDPAATNAILAVGGAGSIATAGWNAVFSSAPEQLYVPVFTNFGTVTAINFSWRQIANRVKVMGKFTAGITVAAEARISLPNGMISDVALIPNIQVCGVWVYGVANAAAYYCLIESGVNYITVGAQTGAITAINKLVGTAFANASVQSVQFEVPISGLNV